MEEAELFQRWSPKTEERRLRSDNILIKLKDLKEVVEITHLSEVLAGAI